MLVRMPLETRLRMLEVVELRALGWVSSTATQQFYQDRLAAAGRARQDSPVPSTRPRPRPRPAQSPALQQLQEDTSTSSRPNSVQLPAMQQLQQLQQPVAQVVMQVEGRPLYLSSPSSSLVAQARDHLTALFSAPPPPQAPAPPLVSHKYSRERLMALGRSEQVRGPPSRWAARCRQLPQVILRRAGQQ